MNIWWFLFVERNRRWTKYVQEMFFLFRLSWNLEENLSLKADAINDRKPIEFLLDSNRIRRRMKKFSCEKFCPDGHLVVVCLLSFFFVFLWPGSRWSLRVRQVGWVKWWLGDDGDDSLDDMGKVDIRSFTWWWSPYVERLVIPRSAFNWNFIFWLPVGNKEWPPQMWRAYQRVPFTRRKTLDRQSMGEKVQGQSSLTSCLSGMHFPQKIGWLCWVSDWQASVNVHLW